jgi:glycosyltransferase involved in cell wall biosynthesis
MKILYVSPYPPAADGIGDYTWLLADSAAAAGHEIRVLVPYAAREAPPEVIGSLAPPGRRNDVLMQAVEQWRPDIVHVQFAIAAFGARTAALLRCLERIHSDLRIPVIATMHELERESALLPVVARLVHRRLAGLSDHIIVHTESSRDALLDIVPMSMENVSVIQHLSALPRLRGSDTCGLRGRFALGDARVLLAFGFINPQKGLEDLISAIGILRDTRPACVDDLRVVIAGGVRTRHGPFRLMELADRVYLARLIRQVRRRHLRGVVIRTGYVPDDDVAGWLDLADAVVLPYRTASQSGVAALALACGVPVLASAVGGLPALLAGSPWFYPPRSPARMADTIERFLTTTQPGRERSAQPLRADDGASAATVSVYRAVMAGPTVRDPRVA